MPSALRACLFLSILFLSLLMLDRFPVSLGAQEASTDPTTEMQQMMDRVREVVEPGENHKLLNRFLGTWSTELRITMGPEPSEPEAGTATFRWAIQGRWLLMEADGKMMGRPLRSLSVLGYDNFKKSYVVTSVSSADTMMNRSEGDIDPRSGALILYGTMDEYLTGEHDKVVKTIWRFPEPDRMVLEVHDLAIGESNTRVVEMNFKRVVTPATP